MKNKILKIAFLILITLGISFTFLQTTKANTEYNIEWKAVTGTAIPSTINRKPLPAYIGNNTKIRRGKIIVFEASIDAEYVLYAGNCNTQMLYRLAIGSFNNQRQPENIEPYLNEKWFSANKFQKKLLTAACS